MKLNVKAIESWARHLKGNAATALLVPAFLEAIHRFTPKGFTYGVNNPTLLLILLAAGVATVTVIAQLLTKSRPEFAPEIKFVANDATAMLEKQLAGPAATHVVDPNTGALVPAPYGVTPTHVVTEVAPTV